MTDKIAVFLILVVIWLAAAPVLFLIVLADPQQTIEFYRDLGWELPSASQPLIYYITSGRLFFLGIITSLLMIALQLRVKDSRRLFISGLGLLIIWNISLFMIFLALILPHFKVFEVVQ